MKPDTNATAVSRRDALRQTLLASLGLSTLPASAATQPPEPPKEEPFVPENTYPFFGHDPFQSDTL